MIAKGIMRFLILCLVLTGFAVSFKFGYNSGRAVTSVTTAITQPTSILGEINLTDSRVQPYYPAPPNR